MTQSKSYILVNRVIVFIIFIGIAFSFYNFICNRSLWADEALLALNITNKSWLELFRPLGMNQVAPIGFILIEKIFISFLGDHDWVLRLFPFVTFLISIPLLINIIKLKFQSDSLAFFSAAIFVLNSSILYYSSEVKQYSVDVFVTLLIWFTISKYGNLKNTKSIILISIVGVTSIFLSNISVIILFSSAIYLLNIHLIRKETPNFIFLIPFLFWLSAFILYYIQFIRNHPSHDFMISYWSARKAFPPQQIFSPSFRNFVFSKIQMLFSTFSDCGKNWIIFAAFFVCGVFTLFKKRQTLSFCIIPIIIHFLLSYFRLYPFETRLMIYLIPLITIVFSCGFFYTVDLLHKITRKKFIDVVLILPLVVLVVSNAQSLPVQREEIKNSLYFININKSDDENIFVYYISNPSFNYYKKRYSSISGNPSVVFGNWHIHGCGRSFLLEKKHQSSSIDEEELLLTKGKFWLLFSGVPASDYFKIDGENEEMHFVNQFIKHRYKILKKALFVGSSCYLFQKTD